MRSALAWLGLIAVMAVACGKYGPPVRSRPAPEPAAAPSGAPAEEEREEREPTP